MKPRTAAALAASALAALAAPLAVAFAVAQAHRPFRLGTLINTAGVDPTAGQALFQQNCSACHATQRNAVEGSGPNLAAIGRDAAGRREGLDAPGYLLESILDPAAFRAPGARGVMPQDIAARLGPGQVRDLVAYLAGLGAEPDLDRIARLEVPEARDEDAPRRVVIRSQMERGLEVLRTKAACINCHTLHPERKYQHLLAPPLFLASAFDDAYLVESIREPSRVIAEGFETVHVATVDGRVLSGRLLRDEPDALLMLTLDAQGAAEPVAIPRDLVETDDDGRPAIVRTDVSPMPQGFADQLTAEEIDAVVALLKCLN